LCEAAAIRWCERYEFGAIALTLTRDKVTILGNVLTEMYEAKLARQFPSRPCRVSLFTPKDESDLIAYELTFWQVAHESTKS